MRRRQKRTQKTENADCRDHGEEQAPALDDDKAAVVVTPSGTDTLVLEGDATTQITDSYTVELSRPPADGETVTVTLGGDPVAI